MFELDRIYLRRDCIVIVEENDEKSVITSSVSDLVRLYHNGGYQCPNDDAKVIYCSIFNVKMKCKTFKELMDMLEKIVADCC
jgi:hypothetical protein|nr:MAG TPA: hypothetical protein [Caudoviricetes sp.]